MPIIDMLIGFGLLYILVALGKSLEYLLAELIRSSNETRTLLSQYMGEREK